MLNVVHVSQPPTALILVLLTSSYIKPPHARPLNWDRDTKVVCCTSYLLVSSETIVLSQALCPGRLDVVDTVNRTLAV